MKYFKFIVSSFISKDTSSVFLYRLGTVLSGLVILYIVTSLMEIKDQGAYYLILSLVALQSFVDLGVISVMASVILRDWTEFKNTTSYQTRENKISIIRGYAHFFLPWYLALSLLLLSFSIIYSFNYKGDNQLFKILISISFISSLNFFLNFFWLFLEGIGDYFKLYSFRLIQLIFTTICLYLLIIYDFGLDSFLYFYYLVFFSSLIFIVFKWQTFSFLILGDKVKFRYFTEIFPFHFKIFIQSIFGYFTWQAMIPLFYSRLGPVFAGKLGFTVQLATLILSFSTFLIYSKSPVYSKLFYTKDFDTIWNLWKRDLWISYLTFSLLILFYLVLYFFNLTLLSSIFDRGLSVSTSLIILLIHSFHIFNQSIAVLTRLNKNEILSISGVLVPILSYAIVFFSINFVSLDLIFCLVLFLNFLFFIYNYLRFRKFKLTYLSY